MATESFFEDMVLDTPETVANFIDFIKESPHVKNDGDIDIKWADKESIERFTKVNLERAKNQTESQLPE